MLQVKRESTQRLFQSNVAFIYNVQTHTFERRIVGNLNGQFHVAFGGLVENMSFVFQHNHFVLVYSRGNIDINRFVLVVFDVVLQYPAFDDKRHRYAHISLFHGNNDVFQNWRGFTQVVEESVHTSVHLDPVMENTHPRSTKSVHIESGDTTPSSPKHHIKHVIDVVHTGVHVHIHVHVSRKPVHFHVVLPLFMRVTQGFVGRIDFLEFLSISPLAVRVMLHRELTVSLFQIPLGGIPGHT